MVLVDHQADRWQWHLGQRRPFLPMNQGFDYWYGLPDSHDMRMTAPRANGLKSAPHDLRAPLTGAGPSPRRVLFYYWDNELRAVRKGP